MQKTRNESGSSESDSVDIALLGQRIRLVRTDLGMTLADVARETGLSTGFLSQVENGLTNVSLGALYRIAGALKITAPELLAQGAEPIVSVVRRDEGVWRSADEADPPQLARMLTSAPRRRMEIRECVVPPGFRSDPAWTHAGDEILYVLEGTVSVELEGHGVETLEAGDTMVFVANVPHRWIGGDSEARLLNIVVLHPGLSPTLSQNVSDHLA
ncbi:helix-turn-helix domain-containing protein [Candidatus Poriferisodalis sp.]|uniref:helix-turn-helix domain-containing protein n=1 Tax=Candidatus Poriferisodalis sp. TaxID=3101277 RepID=UPI003B023AEF